VINKSTFSFLLNSKADFTVKLNSEVRDHQTLHWRELYFHFVTHSSDAITVQLYTYMLIPLMNVSLYPVQKSLSIKLAQ